MMQDELTQQLAQLIRDELLKNNQVEIKGLGIFSRKHIPAEEETKPDGTIMLHPPKDTIEFEPNEVRS
jgi:nucleoid DNA-binding protein